MAPWKHRRLTLERMEKFLSAQYFEDVNLYSQLNVSVRPDAIQLAVASIPGEHPTFAEIQGATFTPCKVGDTFGPSWSTHWFRVEVHLPADYAGKPDVLFEWDSECEAFAWTAAGEPIQAFTGGNGCDRRAELRLGLVVDLEAARRGPVVFYLEMACNGMFGNDPTGGIRAPKPDRTFPIKTARLVLPNLKARRLYQDMLVIEGMAKHLPEESDRGQKAMFLGNEVVNTFWPNNDASLDACLALTTPFLSTPTSEHEHLLHVVGHCHIDTAWLWPYRETRRKIGRSWATQLRLMDAYPEYTFACSQAQQYQWLLEDYPSVFAQVKQRAKEGRFIPMGGTWVEMDCNLPCGESLVRQFLYGQRFYEQHFGIRCRVFWLPDTFGYAAQLPQIMRGVGCEYFLTQKLSWNLLNKFPHSSFHWQGLNGDKVLTHFPPADTYNGQADVKEALFAVSNNKDRDRSSSLLHLIGNGDGGGGPLPDMLERVGRMRNTLGLPRMKFSHPDAFFDELKATAGDKLLTWVGELYLELHRGTYTSQAFVKAGNRRMEGRLRETEALALLALQHGSKYKYPREELLRLWRLLLLTQFHDVIPGSSIGLVYKDVVEHLADLDASTRRLQHGAFASLQHVQDVAPPASGGWVVFNCLGNENGGILALPDATDADVAALEQRGALVQRTPGRAGESPAVLVQAAPAVPPLTLQPLQALKQAGHSVAATITAKGIQLRNAWTLATISPRGELVEFVDISHPSRPRNLLPAGATANRLMVYEDIPLFWDAWDVELYHREKPVPLAAQPIVQAATITENGPLRVAVTLAVRVGDSGKSTLTQTISLDVASPTLRFRTRVDWHENRRILKAEFPLDVLTDRALFETQFGTVTRPTHSNTSWDAAKFEVCAHRFAALCEHNYGVALLNDSKYGHSVLPGGQGLSLSLLRSPKAPDAECDMGLHDFEYALLPFTGTPASANLVEKAAAFNSPLRVLRSTAAPVPDGGTQHRGLSLLEVSGGAVVESVKLAEDRDTVILRLYEAYGGRTVASLRAPPNRRLVRATRTNMLEEPLPEGALPAGADGSVQLELRPFEIATIEVDLQSA